MQPRNEATSTASAAVRRVDNSVEKRLPSELLLTDLLAHEACQRMGGSFFPLLMKAEASGGRAVSGRLWIRGCESGKQGALAQVSFQGSGWRWVSRAKERLGAEFKVSEYVSFHTDVSMKGEVVSHYARDANVATFFFATTAPVRANVSPVGEIEVQSPTAWGGILGEVSDVFSQDAEEKATQQFESSAQRQFNQKLDKGFSLAIDLCTSQRYQELGALDPGELPEAPYPASGRIWRANQRVRLHPDGLDLAGPFESEKPLHFAVQVDAGGPLDVQILCQTEAEKVATAYVKDEAVPPVTAKTRATLAKAEARTLRAPADCPSVMMARPGAKSQDVLVFRYMVYADDAKRRALVACGKEPK